MSVVSTPALSAQGVRGLYDSWQGWWETTSDASRMRLQTATFLVLTILAYHYSLSTLVSNLNLSTPLAYVGLVPAIALGLGAARSHPAPGEPTVFDRQLDYIVGLPLISVALIIELLLPNRLSAMFWVWRIDLFSFPLFAAGSVALLFGTRAMLRQKLALGYLFFAWPLPYTLLLLQVLNGFTNITISALHVVIRHVSVATLQPGSGGALFNVTHAGKTFPLSVVSACSGVDSVVGFLLVGSAFAALVKGPRLRKTLWLAAGMVLLWGINVGRIVFIFWAGRTYGEHVAINILHPFVGLVTFSLGVVLMMLAMPLLGLRIGVNGTGRNRTPVVGRPRPLAVKRILPAIGLVAVASMVLGVNNTGLRAYDIVADSTGEAKLASFSADPAAPAGWQASYETAYTWATPYFGDESTWLRYLYSSTGAGGDLKASLPITADVIDTTNLESFSAYGVEACYNFHGYTMKDVATVTLTGHITGQALSYATGNNGTWTIVYWIMPVKPIKASSSTHYERVILYLQDTPQTTVSYPGNSAKDIKSIEGALSPANAEDKRLLADRNFMVQFADQVITAQTRIQAGSTLQQTTLASSSEGPANQPSGVSVSVAGVTFSSVAPRWAPGVYNRLTAQGRVLYKHAHPTWFTS